MSRSLGYSLKQSFVQIKRNGGMSVASIFSITAMMLILALFLFLTVNVNYLTEEVKTQFDTIEVFLNDDASTSEIEKMKRSLSEMEGVDSIEFISKEQGMKEFKVRWGESAYLLDGLSENPLPNSLRVKLSDLSDGDVVSNVCGGFPIVEDVRFYADEVNKVLTISNIIQKGAMVIIAFLVVVSVVVVSNTVKLTVMARSDEIKIMKCVGATNWFVRGPLLCEGMMIGIISAIISIAITALVYIRLSDVLGGQTLQLFTVGLVEPKFMIINVAWIFAALGMSIGAFGSIISMRRFLDK